MGKFSSCLSEKLTLLTSPKWSGNLLSHLYQPLVPTPLGRGRPMKWQWRDLLDAMRYVAKTGCQWRALPGDFPPWQSVYRYFSWFSHSQRWRKINHLLSQEWRLRQKREADPSAATPQRGVDSQSVKASETGSFHGYDAGKHIKGTKRHLLVDTQGLLIAAVVHSAAIQDYNGAQLVLEQAYATGRTGRLTKIWADGTPLWGTTKSEYGRRQGVTAGN